MLIIFRCLPPENVENSPVRLVLRLEAGVCLRGKWLQVAAQVAAPSKWLQVAASAKFKIRVTRTLSENFDVQKRMESKQVPAVNDSTVKNRGLLMSQELGMILLCERDERERDMRIFRFWLLWLL